MKHRVIVPLFLVLLAMLMVAGSNKAEAAVSVGVGIGIGGGYHHGGGVVAYSTVDPSYNTWYPDAPVAYVYPDVVPSDEYVAPYLYDTPSIDVGVGFGGWYGGGGGGGGRGGHYGHAVRSGGGGHRR